MGRSLGVLMLGLASACLLWEGAQCLLRNYWLTAPPAVSVPLGLCVIIPCNFTYEQRHADRDAPLYGYWFEAESVYTGAPVATNNPRKTVQSYTRNRFTLSEHLDQGDCSLTIKNARKTDRKQYIFRVEREPRAKFTYSFYAVPYVNVTELGKPEIRIPRELRAGQPVNITCTAPASCPPMSPNMTWEGISEASTSGISAMLPSPSGSDVYRTVFNFRPSVADHGKLLTCSVSYGKGPRAVQTAHTFMLDVHYPPQTPQFSGELIRANRSLQNFSGVTQIRAQRGDSVVLRCEVKGNPVPSVTWVRGPQPPQTLQLVSSENELKLSSLTQQHEGKYECRAQNSEGFSNATFLLSMKLEDPSPWRLWLVSGVIGAIITLALTVLIIAVIVTSKRCRKGRKSVTGSSSYTEQPTADQSEHLPPPKDSHIMGGNEVLEMPEKTNEAIYSCPDDPRELHYASLQFNILKTIPESLSEEPQTEYAEIKVS
ncbi:sialic acid-binding Ig-like lectin 12 isoform X2 [Varanus komodoensis]|uniref:sialic acid-binding Ig-like lectin 12 isoform X2 n=1 Tax=Varanus komodoensis TaxID=61221 RepID=UPI001CF7B48B|nr:sialic acid-binding Ig-like lectin 12 isoform X2 [Varanus komodoensis]